MKVCKIKSLIEKIDKIKFIISAKKKGKLIGWKN